MKYLIFALLFTAVFGANLRFNNGINNENDDLDINPDIFNAPKID